MKRRWKSLSACVLVSLKRWALELVLPSFADLFGIFLWHLMIVSFFVKTKMADQVLKDLQIELPNYGLMHCKSLTANHPRPVLCDSLVA